MIEFAEGVPVVNVHISHIRGAKPNSARYDPNMSDEKRAAYANVVLLCKPHHDLVDRIRPHDYPPETLQKWKSDHERTGLGALADLHGLTEERLTELIESVVVAMGPVREVILELTGGICVATGGVLSVPIEKWRALLEHNQEGLSGEQVIVATALNTGHLRATVEAVDIYVSATSGHGEVPMTLMGRNDFPYVNPPLPAPLEVGACLRWLTDLATVRWMITNIEDSSMSATELWAVTRLGSGESIESKRYSIADLPTV